MGGGTVRAGGLAKEGVVRATNEKYFLNLAGEYRVAAELLKRQIFATVTLGNMKGADVIAVGKNRRAAIIEVKASRSSRFVTKLYQTHRTPEVERPTFWVLYSVRTTSDGCGERFFILTHDELADAQALRNCPDQKLSYEECVRRFAGGVDNVLIRDVERFEDDWLKIIEWCNERLDGP